MSLEFLPAQSKNKEFTMEIIITVVIVTATALLAGGLIAKNLIHVCGPNEALVFSGSKTKVRGNVFRGYRIIKGGRGMKWPLLEEVDKLDLTNMIIEVSVTNAYAKGGIPLTVSGVANLKIASVSPALDNAIERFIGKGRREIIKIAKETLEGNLRGVLSQLTPEKINEDKVEFESKLLDEADHDLAKLGLTLDTLKIQNITDDRGFLDSIGRIKSAEVIKVAKIAEAEANAKATVREASNIQMARLAEIDNQRSIITAEAERKIQDAKTKASALAAEERGRIQAQIARAKADIKVQTARVEQIRRQLQADIIEPAKAGLQSNRAEAKGQSAKIVEDGKATVAVLNEMISTWERGGDSARDIFLMQKLQSVMNSLVSSIDNVTVNKIAILPNSSDSTATKAAVMTEELKAAIGLDLPKLLEQFGQNQKK
jgi:flotillin